MNLVTQKIQTNLQTPLITIEVDLSVSLVALFFMTDGMNTGFLTDDIFISSADRWNQYLVFF